jgi:hypothetical protein
VKCGEEILQMNVLYDWGATASMITHRAAVRAKLLPVPRKEQEVAGLNGTKSRSGCTYEVPMMDHAGQIKLIHAAGVDKIAWLEEGNLPPKLKSMFPELAGKTTILRQKKGEVDILMGLDNSRWLPRQVNDEGKPPSNFRLMKSKFVGRYMIMGSDAGMRRPKKIERPARDALQRIRRGWVALTLLLMAASSREAQEICGAEGKGAPGAGVDSAGCGNHHGHEGMSDPRITALWWALGFSDHHNGPVARAQIPDDQPLGHSLLHRPAAREVHASTP